jgi:hypothetical protein
MPCPRLSGVKMIACHSPPSFGRIADYLFLLFINPIIHTDMFNLGFPSIYYRTKPLPRFIEIVAVLPTIPYNLDCSPFIRL